MSDELQRIDALVATGKIGPGEAAELKHALQRMATPTEPAAAYRAPNSGARLRLAFVRGQIDPEDLRRATRRSAVRMGVFFGIGMFLVWSPLMALAMPGPFGRSLLICTMVAPLHLLISGPLFGWAMYRFYLCPATERLVALVGEAGPLLDAPARSPAGRCPCCAAENAKVWDRSHFAMKHWVWNPGLAVNELLFGQRVPESMSFCRECGSQFTDCPSCRTAIDGLHWSTHDAFGNWSGLECPYCQEDVPCLRNAWAGLFLKPLRWVGLAARV